MIFKPLLPSPFIPSAHPSFYFLNIMASLYTEPHTELHTGASSRHHRHHHHHHSISASTVSKRSLTREDLLAMARNEYARQLCKFTEAQLKQRVPSCVTSNLSSTTTTTTTTTSSSSSTASPTAESIAVRSAPSSPSSS